MVTQRVRRSLDYQVRDAKRGGVYLQLEYDAKVARYDTENSLVIPVGKLPSLRAYKCELAAAEIIRRALVA